MDLGALVRRLVAGPSGAGGASASVGAGSASAPESAGVGDPLPRPAWRDAPPIQRFVGSAPLVAPNAPFEARLATSQPAPLALAPLGHDHGLEAPAGLVAGIAAPVQRSPSTPMPASVRTAHGARPGAHATVQRAAALGGGLGDVGASPSPMAETPFPNEAEIPEVAPSPAPGGTVVPAVAAPSPLVTAPSPVAGLVGLIGPAAVASASRSSWTSGVAAPAEGGRAAAGAPATSTVPLVARSATADGADWAATPSSSSAIDASAASTASAHSADRPVRRIRLGAPLTPTVSRLAIPGSSAGALPSFASTAASHAASPVGSPGASTSAPAAIATGQAPVSRAGAATAADAPGAAAGPSSLPGPESHTSAQAPVGAAPTDPSPALPRLQRSTAQVPSRGPLVGGLRPVLTPATSAIAVSRRAAPEAEPQADVHAPGSSAEALAALGRPDWASDGGGWTPTVADAMTAGSRALGAPGSPFAVEPAQGGIAPARLTWTNPLADPSPTGAAADPATMDGPRPGTQPMPGAAPTSTAPSASGSSATSPTVSRSIASRPGSPRAGLRVGPAMTASLPGSPSRPVAELPVRWSANAASRPAGGTPSAEPIVSRAVTIDEVEVTPEASAASAESGAAGAASGAGAPASSTAGSAAAGTAGAAGSEAARDQETQAWADRLYDRISMRLRRDLLVERERSGALVDRGF